MKKIVSSVLCLMLFLIPSFINAQQPPSGVWITPDGALPAEEVTLNALVYNDTKELVIVVVEFKTTTATIAKTDPVSVPAQSAKTVSVKWIIPAESATVSANVISAKNSLKKDVPSLVGLIGTMTVGKTIVPKASIKGFFAKVIDKIETFRIRQLEYFTTLKQKHQSVLAPNAIEDIGEMLQPDSPQTPGETEDKSNVQTNTKEYITLVYASIGKSYFEHKAFFYVSVVLIFLFILRFIFNRFS